MNEDQKKLLEYFIKLLIKNNRDVNATQINLIKIEIKKFFDMLERYMTFLDSCEMGR